MKKFKNRNTVTYFLSNFLTLLLCGLLIASCEEQAVIEGLIKEEVQEENGLHAIVKVSEEPQLSEWLTSVTATLPNGRKENSFLDRFELHIEEGVRRKDSVGNLVYSMYLGSGDPLSLYNLWLYKEGDSLIGRVIHQRINKEWLIAQDSFPGWDQYTGYFTVYDLNGEVLYETDMVDGESQEVIDSNGRAAELRCYTRTVRVCSGGGRNIEEARNNAEESYNRGDYSRCYTDITTSCTWSNNNRELRRNPLSGPTTAPFPIAEYERIAACGSDYKYSDVHGCVPRCGSGEELNSSKRRCICLSGYEKYRGSCVRECSSGVRNSNGTCKSSADVWEEDKICTTRAFDLNLCLSSVWDKLKQQNSAYKLLKNFNAENPTAQVCMDISNSLPSNVHGRTYGRRTPIEIKINKNKLSMTSPIEVARTLFHELIHAEMYRKLRTVGYNPSSTDFEGLFANYSKYFKIKNPDGTWNNLTGSPQHNIMAQHYLGHMRDALMEFDGIDLSNYSMRTSYEALAWMGLTETDPWLELHQIERDFVKQKIRLYSTREKCE